MDGPADAHDARICAGAGLADAHDAVSCWCFAPWTAQVMLMRLAFVLWAGPGDASDAGSC